MLQQHVYEYVSAVLVAVINDENAFKASQHTHTHLYLIENENKDRGRKDA